MTRPRAVAFVDASPPPSTGNRRLALAAGCMAAAALLFGLLAVLVKLAAARLPSTEVSFVRFAVGLLACLGVSLKVRLRAHNWRGLFWRGAFGGGAVLCYFVTLAHLPVGVATLLQYTSPVFIALWAWLFMKEPIGAGTVGALALATAGVALVLSAHAPAGAFGFGRWELLGLGGAVLSGAAVATIREVRKTDGSWEIFAAFCVAGALFTGTASLGRWVAPSGHEWLLLAAVGVISVTAQLLMTWSLGDLPATTAGILFQLTPVAALALGHLWFGERPGGLALLGAAVTLAGVLWGGWLGARPRSPVDELALRRQRQ